METLRVVAMLVMVVTMSVGHIMLLHQPYADSAIGALELVLCPDVLNPHTRFQLRACEAGGPYRCPRQKDIRFGGILGGDKAKTTAWVIKLDNPNFEGFAVPLILAIAVGGAIGIDPYPIVLSH